MNAVTRRGFLLGSAAFALSGIGAPALAGCGYFGLGVPELAAPTVLPLDSNIVGTNTVGLSLAPSGQALVAGRAGIMVFDRDTPRQLGVIKPPAGPAGAEWIWMPNGQGGPVYAYSTTGYWRIDTSAMRTVDALVPPADSRGWADLMTVSPDGHHLVWAWTTSPKMSVTSPGQHPTPPIILPSAPNPLGPILLSPDGSRAYYYPAEPGGAAPSVGPTLVVVDVNTGTARPVTLAPDKTLTDPLDNTFVGLALSPDGHRLYALTRQRIDVIDTTNNAVVTSIPIPDSRDKLPNFADALTISPSGRYLFVHAPYDTFVFDSANTHLLARAPQPVDPDIVSAMETNGRLLYLLDASNKLTIYPVAQFS